MSASVAISNTWYANELQGTVRQVGDSSASVARFGRIARGDELILVHSRARGLRKLLLHEIFRRKPRVVLLEFIRTRPSGFVARALDELQGLLVRHSALRIHVLTESEADDYAARYRIPRNDFVVVKWPLLDDRQELARPLLGTAMEPRKVVASGRASCDWETVFQAAKLSGDWRLTIICGEADRLRVERLNDVDARVFVDVVGFVHDSEVASAQVYLLALKEEHASSGHIRLMKSIGLSVPVVATKVAGLEGYLEDDVTASVISSGDPAEMARRVNYYLDHEEAGVALASRATIAVQQRSFSRYLTAIKTDLLAPREQPLSRDNK